MYRLNYLGARFEYGDTGLEGLDYGGLFLDGRDEERGEAIVGHTLGTILIRTRGDDLNSVGGLKIIQKTFI